jgi:hypothetical protein
MEFDKQRHVCYQLDDPAREPRTSFAYSISHKTIQSWGSSFFVSLVDSTGLSWAYGPLHSGGQGDTKCLAIGHASSKTVSEGIAFGSGFGGLVAGILVGGLCSLFFLRHRRRHYYDHYIRAEGRKSPGERESIIAALPNSLLGSFSAQRPTPSGNGRAYSDASTNSRYPILAEPGYEVEPFILPSSGSLNEAESQTREVASDAFHNNADARGREEMNAVSPTVQSTSIGSSHPRTTTSGSGQVYVVHHDGGRAPVTVYTADGTEIIELPPRYDNDRSESDNQDRNSQPRRHFDERRRLGPRPVKTSPSGSNFGATNT